MRIKNARALAPEQSVVDEKMFLARIEGTVVATAKHPSLEGCRFLVARRLEADGSAAAEPNVVVDWMGAARGETVMVSTDGDIAREKLGNNTPARMVVVGLVDAVQQPVQAEGAA
jgi:ethanolamine utilization protein EutN